MVSATFLTGAIVAFGFRVVIASPCRPSSQAGVSSEIVLSFSISSETFLAPTPSFDTSTTDEIYFSETATLSLSSFATESLSSTSSLVVDAGTDSTGLYSTAVSSATETGSTAAVTSEESTTIATTATSETTTWPISDTVTSAEIGTSSAVTSDESTAIATTAASKITTWSISEAIATTESEGTTWAATGTTDEPITISMSQTTTEETVSTAEYTPPPVPTSNLVARSQSIGDVVMHSYGGPVLASTFSFPSSWSSSITYDENTAHLKVKDVSLCVMYEPLGRLASLTGCPSVCEWAV